MTDLDHQTDIMIETGTLENAEVADNIARWWSDLSGKDNQRVRCKIQVLEVLLGQTRELVDRQVGSDKVSASQMFRNVSAMLQLEQAKLDDSAGIGKRAGSVTPKQAVYVTD